MKAYSKSGAVPPVILNLGNSGQPHTPSALPRRMSLHYPLLGGWVDCRASMDILEKRKLRVLLVSLSEFEPWIVQPLP